MLLRPARASDAPFLAQVLALAADWRAAVPRSGEQVLTDTAAARYVAGWPLPGDHGVVAAEQAGEPAVESAVEPPGEDAGAAWWRYLPGGYGFVRADVPEVTLGVLPGQRGRGTGTALLERLVADARAAGLPALSLSVEADNRAVRLYRRLGFTEVDGPDGALTMLLSLP